MSRGGFNPRGWKVESGKWRLANLPKPTGAWRVEFCESPQTSPTPPPKKTSFPSFKKREGEAGVFKLQEENRYGDLNGEAGILKLSANCKLLGVFKSCRELAESFCFDSSLKSQHAVFPYF
ncbi:hypothetical protein KKF38_05405 [Patescibacteria group bacterium]|nr:hypothetical protein [Patescibacteria group bacterium]